MGKFINTVRKDTINNIIDGYKDRLKNPYYMYSDKKPTIVDYYTINKESSTLDDGLKTAYEQLGEDSPFRYNHIKDFYIYDIDQIQLQIENDEFGLEAETITGNGIILPNTIIPSPGDLFKITYLNNSYVFKVITVNIDTIESGANFYKIDYEFYKKNDSELKDLVVDNYVMIVNNVGTDFKPVIKSMDYDYISIIEDICIKLKQYYKYLFYNHRVESFTFNYNDINIYDPFMTEFLIRNDVLSGDGEGFMYLTHQVKMPLTFNIDYDNTMFRSIETHKLNNRNNNFAYGIFVDQPLSLLGMKKENYFYLKYTDKNSISINKKIEIFNEELINNIFNNILYTIDESSDDEVKLSNFIIKYFNNISISIDDLNILQNLRYESSIYLFYYIPIIIYILEYTIKEKLTK